tara:strand:- start:323 stop:472 length:150 start_codon:yes stop_codon:yes gene_type:complete
VSNQKNQNMGVKNPHIQEIEQNENKLSGYFAENKGKKMVNMLDFNPNIC